MMVPLVAKLAACHDDQATAEEGTEWLPVWLGTRYVLPWKRFPFVVQ
jgi:hypothetical protein